METTVYNPTADDLLQLMQVQLIHAVLETLPDLPADVRLALLDRNDRILRSTTDEPELLPFAETRIEQVAAH